MLSLAIFVVLLVGCSRQAVAPDIEAAEATESESASPAAESPKRSEALSRLIARASEAYQTGDYQTVVDVAERGLRMDRYAPELYLLLAQGYYGLGLSEQAVSFARLGLRYISARPDLKPALQALVEAD
ncbi:hypothetical protein R50072_04160 [Simiduia litorea]